MPRNAAARVLQETSPCSHALRKLYVRVPYAYALLQTLSFSGRNPEHLEHLNDAEWRNLLDLCDRTQLTLLLGDLGAQYLPPWVQQRILRNQLDNSTRFSRVQMSLAEISEALARKAIEFVILKGFTNASHFIHNPKLRSQGDLDLWCQPDVVWPARDALNNLGYRAIGKSKGRHLDPMIREASWDWNGDYYAPSLPIPVDLHYQLWDASMEYIAGPSEAAMWERRSSVVLPGGQCVQQLDLADALTFACVHVLMHLLHGDVRLQRFWELAFFMHSHSDESFWEYWKSLYSIEERQMYVIPLALGFEWFGCKLPGVIAAEITGLPMDTLFWMDRYCSSPLISFFSTGSLFENKDELLLNLCLLRSFKSKARVVARRLLPIQAVASDYGGENTGRNSLASALRLLRFKVERLRRHIGSLPLACWRLALWSWRCRRLSRDLVIFPIASHFLLAWWHPLAAAFSAALRHLRFRH